MKFKWIWQGRDSVPRKGLGAAFGGTFNGGSPPDYMVTHMASIKKLAAEKPWAPIPGHVHYRWATYSWTTYSTDDGWTVVLDEPEVNEWGEVAP